MTAARGKEVFSFDYDQTWLGSGSRQQLDPSMALYSGTQYPGSGRGTTVLMNLQGTLHPYVLNLAYRELVGSLPMEERLRRMRDPEVRAKILASDWDLCQSDLRCLDAHAHLGNAVEHPHQRIGRTRNGSSSSWRSDFFVT